MSERRGGLLPFRRAQGLEHVRHRRARFGPVRLADERLQVTWVHAGADLGEARGFLRANGQGRVAGVAGDAIQLLNQNQPLQLRVELARSQSGNHRLREPRSNDAQQQQGSEDEPGEDSRADRKRLVAAQPTAAWQLRVRGTVRWHRIQWGQCPLRRFCCNGFSPTRTRLSGASTPARLQAGRRQALAPQQSSTRAEGQPPVGQVRGREDEHPLFALSHWAHLTFLQGETRL